jgi:hypothetical protein
MGGVWGVRKINGFPKNKPKEKHQLNFRGQVLHIFQI